MADALKPTPRYWRVLRIGWTVGCVVVAVLLIILWSTSYWWRYEFDWPMGSAAAGIESFEGGVVFRYFKLAPNTPNWTILGIESVERARQLNGNRLDYFTSNFTSNSMLLSVPHLLLILVTATMGADPWLPRRFSLRTLLLATTLVCVALGVVLWAVG